MATTSRTAAAEQWLRQLLASGSPGMVLPSSAEIGKRFGLEGVQSIRNAIEPLKREGLVETAYSPRRHWRQVRVPDVENPNRLRELAGEMQNLAHELLARSIELNRLLDEQTPDATTN